MRWLVPLLLVPAAVLPAQIRFQELGAGSGVDFVLDNAAAGRYRQIELMPGGLAAFDYNGDGCTDLYFTNGAALPSLQKTGPRFHNRLYRNNCNLTFTDVTAEAGVAGAGYSMAAATADYDNDGRADLFVAGVNRNILYRNLGDGRFEDLTEKARLSGIDPKHGKMWSISAGWLDYDNDGLLDLFVSNYVRWDPRTEKRCGSPEHPLYCHPDNYRGLPNQLFRNNGDGTFTDVSAASGIAAHIGKGMGVAFADFDDDGFQDIYVANDSVRSFLFRNGGDGTFRETGLEAGVALRDDGSPIAAMGADFRDFDNDGKPDLVVTGMINDTFLLFRNLGRNLLFEDLAWRSGIAAGTRQLTGWGTGIYDFDNDGWKDLFFANAHFPQLDRYLRGETPLPNRVFRNLGGTRFQDVSQQAGAQFQAPAYHRGAAFADFDNDGRIDVAVSALNARARLFRNVTPLPGRWLALKLPGAGARVKVVLADSRTLYNHATTSVGYASSSEPQVHFGLGAHASAAQVEIRWPDGSVQKLTDVAGSRVVAIEKMKNHTAKTP